MADPWLHILGLGEDGLDGLPAASRDLLDAAEIIIGGPRHLALAQAGSRGVAWPVPFSTAPVLAARGRRTVVLASGDPFWHGAGGSLIRDLAPGEWVSHPTPSSFQLACNRLGWRMEEVLCLGLHAAPCARLRPLLTRGTRALVTLRDGAAATGLCDWLTANGHPNARVTLLERLGGPQERIGPAPSDAPEAPLLAAIEAHDPGLPRTPGLPDTLFQSDGQITKAPVRALTLAALAPRAGEHLWDLGAGSGSVSVEWCLAGGSASAVEARADRLPNIRANAESFGLAHRLHPHHGDSAERIADLPRPDAVFIGGGLTPDLLTRLWALLPEGTRLVANAVTLETEATLYAAHATHGGSLLRIDLAQSGRLGAFRDWQAARPVVQWSVTR
ncbi:bifunctional cobalt-precorrin-7 (C(5))-methyltransferase/cobalt-precorrin-6B (C(15))-methyltransferase [Gemmobacter sp. LW-1]|uniref:bifunctional cobalt-precorrin-7 (C(5))-methyltransferase/cobalt-precorrin-6B (C(15))-methyltransferase n=1 Tax=Gemmobacter sp. LW-1 TaxID=1529005 RepID=UPI0006C73685|nr:bifunctional cobalt-precorrin-7 (C(5))-methyltransferase/cobalt-precorrin-6B (C(15))-methyltransferase [Gemmobacter sp. LW-1]